VRHFLLLAAWGAARLRALSLIEAWDGVLVNAQKNVWRGETQGDWVLVI
jgi:hypothetical protein